MQDIQISCLPDLQHKEHVSCCPACDRCLRPGTYESGVLLDYSLLCSRDSFSTALRLLEESHGLQLLTLTRDLPYD